MITPSFNLTATERVLPKLALDFTTASLDSRITFTRALDTATRVNNFGNIEIANANIARFDYDPSTFICKGLLIEESRVNSIRNNTMVGAVSGTPGAMPTNWSTFTPLTGLTREIVGIGTENGVTYADIKLSGIPSAAGAYYVFFETNTGVVAATGQSWSISSYLKLAAGSLAGITSFNLEMDELTSVGGFVALKRGGAITPTTASLISQRNTYAVALSGGATVARVQPLLIIILTGAAINVTFRIGLPQLELGAFTTSVIPTSSGAVTRNADVATMTGTNFSNWWYASEGAAVIQALPSTISNTRPSIQFDDNTANESIALRGVVADPQLFVVDGGSPQVTLDAGTITANTVYKLGGAWKASSFATAINGATAVTSASGTLPTATQARLGSDGTNYFNGHLQNLRYWPQRLTNAEVQAFSK